MARGFLTPFAALSTARSAASRSPTARPVVQAILADGKEFEAEVLLVAVGRGPVSLGLGSEEAGAALHRGYVLVDEYMCTYVPTISGRR